MDEQRLREALEAVLPWVDTYDDHMGDEDFQRREAAQRFAERVLAGDEEITLAGAAEQICAERAARAATGPKIVLRPY